MKAGLAAAIVCALAAPASADLVCKGSQADQDAFQKLLKECADHSATFKKLLEQLNGEKSPTVTIHVGHTGDYVDSSGDDYTSTINLDNLNKLPEPPAAGAPMPAGTPPWALSRTELLFHIIWEARYSGGKNVGTDDNPHRNAIGKQAAVRDDLKQKHYVHAQTRISGGFQIEFDNYCEKLIWIDGKMTIQYFHGRNCDEKLDWNGKNWTKNGKPFVMASLGAGLPFGNYEAGYAESAEADFAVPVGIGAGYAFGDGIEADAYVSYAPTSASNGIGSDLRFGLEGSYPIADTRLGSAWAGAGVGYELEHSSGPTYDETGRGFEWLHLEGGVDHPLSSKMSIGPFVELGLGRYDAISGTSGGADVSGPIMDRTFHEWLTLGVRGLVGPT